MLGWMFFDWLRGNKPSALGACIGAVVGLVAITPAAGFVTVRESIIIGLVASVVSNLAVHIRTKSTLDDTLDVFPCHGVGGMVGMLATGIFCDKGLLDYGFKPPDADHMPIFVAHLIALVVVSAFAFFGSLILFKITDLIIPLRVTPEQEELGLDLSQHGETALGADLLSGAEVDRAVAPRLAGRQRLMGLSIPGRIDARSRTALVEDRPSRSDVEVGRLGDDEQPGRPARRDRLGLTVQPDRPVRRAVRPMSRARPRGLGGLRAVGPEGEQDQGDRADDEHVVGEVEDRAVEVDRVDVEVDEVADVAQGQPVIAVAQGPGHDQGQGHVSRRSVAAPEDEQPVADPRRRHDRERREDQAAVRDIAHETPEGPGL